MKRIKNGFTLIELLVVISIIALLIGLLMPALAAAKNAAKSMLCMSNQKQLMIAWHSYSMDHQHQNVGSFGTIKRVENGRRVGVNWNIAISEYIGDATGVFKCAEAEWPGEPAASSGTDYVRGTARKSYFVNKNNLVSDDYDAEDNGGYGMNNWTEGHSVKAYKGQSAHLANVIPKVDMIGISPTEVPTLMDATWVDIGWPLSTNKMPTDLNNPDPESAGGNWMARAAMSRHDGGINSAFLDGSVRHILPEYLWNQKWHRTFKKKNLRRSTSWP